jgi:hypothetical protein
MARRSLKPQLNQIRTWVRQGRTDAWIAHQLEVSVKDVDGFKREHELVPSDDVETPKADDAYGPPMEEEPDLRAEDDALVAAALDAEPEESDDDPDDSDDADGDSKGGDGDDAKPSRRRGRRGGRGRRSGGRGSRKPLEGTFDHGSEGYGLWLDPAVQDDPTYAEHWAGHRPVTVTIEQDQIVIRRAGEENGDGDGDSGSDSGSGSGDTDESPALDPDAFDA